MSSGARASVLDPPRLVSIRSAEFMPISFTSIFAKIGYYQALVIIYTFHVDDLSLNYICQIQTTCKNPATVALCDYSRLKFK